MESRELFPSNLACTDEALRYRLAELKPVRPHNAAECFVCPSVKYCGDMDRNLVQTPHGNFPVNLRSLDN